MTKVTKWPLGAAISCATAALMGYYEIWPKLGQCATVAVIILLLGIGLLTGYTRTEG